MYELAIVINGYEYPVRLTIDSTLDLIKMAIILQNSSVVGQFIVRNIETNSPLSFKETEKEFSKWMTAA